MKNINPIWLIISTLVALGITTIHILYPSLIVAGLACAVFGGYLIGRAEEHFDYLNNGKSIYNYLRHPMYIGTTLMLLAVGLALGSYFVCAVAVIWGVVAAILAWKEDHPSGS